MIRTREEIIADIESVMDEPRHWLQEWPERWKERKRRLIELKKELDIVDGRTR